MSDDTLSPAQQALVDAWEEHTRCEFEAKDVDGTMDTMDNEYAYVNNVSVMTGGVGLQGVRDFYANIFIPNIPEDTETTLVSRTVGNAQIVDELVFSFTHTCKMDWMLPGIAPTHKRVEIPLVVFVAFKNGKVSHEHIYWDQASVLVQVGLLDADTLPVTGVECAHKVLDPTSYPSNKLIQRHR